MGFGLIVGGNFEIVCLLNVGLKVRALSQTGNYNGNGMKVCGRISMRGRLMFLSSTTISTGFPQTILGMK